MRNRRKRRRFAFAATIFIAVGAALFAQQRWIHDLRAVQFGGAPTDVAASAHWPWPHAKIDVPTRGVTHWIDDSAGDGTVCELIEFDFSANPNLRFEMFDQDSDDAKPWDNRCLYWPRGAAQMTRQLKKAIPKAPILRR